MTEPCQGPDPHPKKPIIAPPPGACDTHAHVFGPLDRFPFSPGRGYTPPEATPEDFEGLLSALGIDRAVIVHGSAHGSDNRASARAACQGIAKPVAVGQGDAVIEGLVPIIRWRGRSARSAQ